MQAILNDAVVVLIPETPAENEALAARKRQYFLSVLCVSQNGGAGLTLTEVGPRDGALSEPVQISSRMTEPASRLISNFAATPFELDGRFMPRSNRSGRD